METKNLNSWLLSCEAVSHVMVLNQSTEDYLSDKKWLLSCLPLKYKTFYFN